MLLIGKFEQILYGRLIEFVAALKTNVLTNEDNHMKYHYISFQQNIPLLYNHNALILYTTYIKLMT